MPKLNMCHKNEDAAKVFAQRKADALSRIDSLRTIVDSLDPDVKDRVTISRMDYILKALDSVIQDAKNVGA